MPFKYSKIEIFTNEEAVYRGNPFYKAVVQYVSGLKIAARCLVTRCIAGCYENGEIANQSILIASFNMPIVIKIILPSAQAQMILPTLEGMIDEGIMTVQEIPVQCHKTEVSPKSKRSYHATIRSSTSMKYFFKDLGWL